MKFKRQSRTKRLTVRNAAVFLIGIMLLLPLFAAFEAHVVNVKAHIENALKVEPKHMDFGTVFPQEVLEEQFKVRLSDSFLEQERVKDVYYKLQQKRKPREIAKIDVLFAFDLSGSMNGDRLADAKERAKKIINMVKERTPSARFGVISHVDYPHEYTDYYGYTDTYGSDPDYPYNLDAALTSDDALVKTIIQGLAASGGADLPQNYTRVIYEADNDPDIVWRDDAEKAVILFQDSVPHDNDLNEGVPGHEDDPGWTTGGDPGRDELAYTDDDLDWQDELIKMAKDCKRLYEVHYGGEYLDYWKYWTSITGGIAISPEPLKGGDHRLIVEDMYQYLDLRPFLVKEKKPETDFDAEGEADLGNMWPDEAGELVRDLEDHWKVVLKVPCIHGTVGQDYVGPIIYKDGADYGTDIWVEVTGFSYDGPADGFKKVMIGPTVVPTFTEVEWTFYFTVTNDFGYIMKDLEVKDNFGAELDVTDYYDVQFVYGSPGWTYEQTTNPSGTQDRISWTIDELAPGDTGTLILKVKTKLNPAGKQEYTSPGVYEMNSGATLKWFDGAGVMHSKTTDPLEITAVDL